MSVEKPRLLVDGKIFYPTVVKLKINSDGTPVSSNRKGIDKKTVFRWSGFDKTPKKTKYFSMVTLYQEHKG